MTTDKQSTWRVPAAVGLAGLVIVALEGATLLPLRARVVLALHVAVLGLMALWARRELLAPGRLRTALAVGFMISVAPVVAGLALGNEDPFRVFVATLEPTLLGWSVLLAVLPLMHGEAGSGWSSDWKPQRWQVALFLVVAFGIQLVAHQLAVQHLAIVSDEAVFLTQSRWMQFPQVSWPVDADVAPFFRFRKVDFLNGHMYGMYPPGWPALLAAFRYVGLEWWSSMIVGTVAVALTYLIGARLAGRRAGVIAAVLLATSQTYLMNVAGYMSHGAGILGLLAAMWCLLVGLDAVSWRRAMAWIAAGLMFGFVVTVRPLTGLALGLSIGVWMLARAWEQDRRAPLVMAVCVAIGGIIPAWLFIKYNLIVFGKPLALGHEVMHPGMYGLGFGERGFRVLDENLNWVVSSFQHGPVQGFRYLLQRLVGVNTSFLPIGALVPIATVAVAAGFRIRWGLVALFSVLPIALFFYWSSSLRQYIELLPFLLLAVAVMLLAIYQRWPRLAVGLASAVLISQAVSALPWPPEAFRPYRAWTASDYSRHAAPGRWATLVAADSLAAQHDRVLLFSREATRFDIQIDRLYQFNGAGFNGPILVARDLGTRNADLIAKFPDRVPFLVVDEGRDKAATFTRIVPVSP